MDIPSKIDATVFSIGRDPGENTKLYYSKIFKLILNENCPNYWKLRTPAFRDKCNEFTSSIDHITLSLALESRERYEEYLVKMKRNGESYGEDISYEEMVDFFNGGEFKSETSRHNFVLEMIKQASDLTDLLLQREWGLIRSKEKIIITSDNPVTVSWAKPMPAHRPPGYGFKNTFVTLPLSSSFCLLGTFEPLANELLEVSGEYVSMLNEIRFFQASEYLYSCQETFFV